MYLFRFIGLMITFLPTMVLAIQLVSTTDRELTLEFILPSFTIQSVTHEKTTCQQVEIAHWTKTENFPQLPITSTLLQVPQTGAIEVQVLEPIYKEIFLTSPCPMFNEKIIEQPIDSTRLVNISEREMWRDVPVARLLIQPFQWQIATNTLRYVEKMRIVVNFTTPLPPISRQRHQPSDNNPFSNLLQSTLLNYRPVSTENYSLSTTRDGERVANTPSAGIHITVNETGVYQIFYEEFQATGVPLQTINPEKIQLFNQGTEIAIQVVTAQPKQFQPGDFILFYALGLDTEFTDANQYWLQWRTKGQGKRIHTQNVSVTGQANEITTFYSTYRIEKNDELWQGVPGAPEDDYWFWMRLDAPQSPIYKEQEFILPNPVSDEKLEATVNVMFQGRSTAADEPNHHVIAGLNGEMLGDILWSNDVPYMQTKVIQQNLLKNNNLLTIDMPGDTGVVVDTIYFNWLEIAYWRYLAAIDNNLLFTLHDRDKLHIIVTHFTNANIQLYDVTNPEQIIELKDFTVQQTDEGYTLSFDNEQNDSRTYYATTTVLKPLKVQNWQPTGLKSVKNAADYILITDETFLPAMQPLLAWRAQQGLRVKAVSMQAIYKEFNNGVVDPEALKKFLTYAYEHWSRPAPTYVFLVGDASVDYRHYLSNSNKSNYVPVHFSTETKRVLASDDNWYVAVQGNDVLPEMFIGRVPSRNVKTATAIIEKIVNFEKNNLAMPYKTLLISDDKEEYKVSSDIILTYLPTEMEKVEIWLHNYSNYDKATEDITSVINQGVAIVNYTGHGAVAQWGFNRTFFGLRDIQNLNNINRLPFVIALSCANGHFAMPDSYSLSEEFMKTADKGAIASFSPSRLSFYTGNQILAEELFNRVLQPMTLGEITTGAKIAAYARGTPLEFMKMYMLFGDPASRLQFQ